jgi:hypothetical protein
MAASYFTWLFRALKLTLVIFVKIGWTSHKLGESCEWLNCTVGNCLTLGVVLHFSLVS